jgi:predicted transposase YdaD
MLFNEFDMEAERAAEREAGFEEGWKIGVEKAAQNALALGLPMEVIQKITGLDTETLTRLSSQ